MVEDVRRVSDRAQIPRNGEGGAGVCGRLRIAAAAKGCCCIRMKRLPWTRCLVVVTKWGRVGGVMITLHGSVDGFIQAVSECGNLILSVLSCECVSDC